MVTSFVLAGCWLGTVDPLGSTLNGQDGRIRPAAIEWVRYLDNPESSYRGFSIWASGDAIYGLGQMESFLLVKWDLNGNEAWRRTSIGQTPAVGYAVWGDNSSIYTCGRTTEAGLQAWQAGHADALVAKWSFDGTMAWASMLNMSDFDDALSVCSDGQNVYACGTTKNNTSGDSYTNAFLAKWNSTGSLEWKKTWDRGNYDEFTAVGINGSMVYVTGRTQDDQLNSDSFVVMAARPRTRTCS